MSHITSPADNNNNNNNNSNNNNNNNNNNKLLLKVCIHRQPSHLKKYTYS